MRVKRKKSGFGLLFVKVFLFLCVVGFFILGLFFLWASSLKIPDFNSFEQRKVAQSTKIYDRTGEVLLFDVHENIKRTIVPYNEMSRHIKNATVAIEDAEFYEHYGVKPKAFLRAIFVNLGSLEFSQGGSTITQQVVKNSVLTPEKQISRKLKEWVLAVKLEQNLNKEQILELYLNETPYGGSLYGVEEASWAFFGVPASKLSLAQSAYLAALPQAPTHYSPYGNNKEALENRKNLVLRRMLEIGFIDEETYKNTKKEVVGFKPQTYTGIRAPHFVMFVREYLAKKYGERALEERGFKVVTTLDYALQEKAEEIVSSYAHDNVEKFNATNAGLVAIDPRTGQILVMVGSRGYFDEEIDGNFNITTAHRQPGSTFKPFVYATAFNKGYTPETVVFDVRTQFSARCDVFNLTSEEGCYSPQNYDDVFRGPITFRNALAQSINVPAVKVLYLSGLNDSLNTARSMGITGLDDINKYGLTLVLGGGEVSLLDITSAYGVFANKGVRNSYASILRVEDALGNIVEEFSNHQVSVIPKQATLQISDVLSDDVARRPSYGANSLLYFHNRDVAVKTGTTNDYRDAWTIGYTPSLVVGAWAGNNDNSPMEKKVAGLIITPLWNAFMREVLASSTVEYFEEPVVESEQFLKPILRGKWLGGESYFIDKTTGERATIQTPIEFREEKFITNVHSILYWVDKKNPRGPIPTNPEKDPQFDAWEYGIALWKAENNIIDEQNKTTPTGADLR